MGARVFKFKIYIFLYSQTEASLVYFAIRSFVDPSKPIWIRSLHHRHHHKAVRDYMFGRIELDASQKCVARPLEMCREHVWWLGHSLSGCMHS